MVVWLQHPCPKLLFLPLWVVKERQRLLKKLHKVVHCPMEGI